MPRTLRINVDSDGVVYDMQTIFANRAKRHWPDNPLITSEPDQWDIHTVYGLEYEEVREMFRIEARRGLFGHGEAYPGAIDSLRRLSQSYNVRIVTNKAPMGTSAGHAAQDTADFYGRHGLLTDIDLVITRSFGKQDYPADVVIDDHPGMDWAQPHALNLLFDRPWNKDAFQWDSVWLDADRAVIRVFNWVQVEKEIADFAKYAT